MWVKFVVGSCPCSERFFFSGYYVFSLLQKNQHLQIPDRSGNSGSKSHLSDSTEIPIYFHFLNLFQSIHLTNKLNMGETDN